MIRLFVLVVWVISPFVAAQQDLPWSRFRGPNGKGIAESGRLPDKIGPNENVIWKQSLPSSFQGNRGEKGSVAGER